MTSLNAVPLADGRVHLPRLADVVAERIRERILSGELQDGERLPPLEALLSQFGVSAPSMREGLRILEAEGLIVVQRGNVGGAVIHRPAPETAAYTLALVLRSQNTNKRDVAEALALLAPLCAKLCASRADRDSTVVPQLRKINEVARALIDGDELAFNDAMMDFTAALVGECGNDTLKLVTRALGSIYLADVRTWVRTTAEHGQYPTRAERTAKVEMHKRLTDLIEAGDEQEVAAVMTAEIDVTRIYREAVDPTERVDPQAVRLLKEDTRRRNGEHVSD
jgi:GntR family transcriptional regulator, transcriptional repressor for pyruvate dehydrogenase complex